MSKLKKFFLDLFFPVQCLGNCGTWDTWLCKKCQQKIIHPRTLLLPKPSYVTGLYTLDSYENPLLRDCIHNFKYNYAEELGPILGKLLAPLIIQNFDFIIPVPLHKKRYLERGYNQAELIANTIYNSVETRLIASLRPDVLIRTKYTPPQAKITDPKIRVKNMQHCFCVKTHCNASLQNKTILLIDDVYTTGATMQACAQVLKQAGAKEIWGLVLAKG